MSLDETYQARAIKSLSTVEAEGWRLKVYSILHPTKTLDEALIQASKDTALAFLPRPAETEKHYGVGFISVHQGSSFDFVTVAYWTYATELRHQSYMRPSSSSSRLEPVTLELSSDVWDLRVLAFERDAWVDKILTTEEPDLDAYLKQQLNETL